MARVTDFIRENKIPKPQPTETTLRWSIGNGILQIDTWGSGDRETQEKQSQTLQFSLSRLAPWL